MGSEISNTIKPWIFPPKIIPNVLPPDCVLQCLPALVPSAALHLPWHDPSISAPPLIETSIMARDQMAPILLAQPQNMPAWISCLCLFNFHIFVIVHRADNCFVFFLFPVQSNNLCPVFTFLFGSLLWSLYWTLSHCEPLREKNGFL